MSLYQTLFYSSYTNALCSDQQEVARMIIVELALAKAQALHGIVPAEVTEILEEAFQRIEIDIEALKKAIPLTGNAAAPFVKQVVAILKKEHPEAAKYIHLGATSQDIIDTATVLKAKQYSDWLNTQLDTLEVILRRLIEEHRHTVMIGRTLMQQARPITFGLKCAGWLEGVRAARLQLQSSKNAFLRIQLAGAVGSQNEYLTPAVKSSFARLLELENASSWHTQRVEFAGFACALGVVSGSLGKIAKDLVLLSQTEVGEVFEPETDGRGSSSTMPHKRNPVLSTTILANAHRIPFLVASILGSMPQTHERSAGLWHAEWEPFDDIMGLCAGAVECAVEVLDGLEVNPKRMRQNIDNTKGLVFAEAVSLSLAEKLGKETAHYRIEQACQRAVAETKHLRTVIEEMSLAFTGPELDELFEPENALGKSQEIIDEILAKA